MYRLKDIDEQYRLNMYAYMYTYVKLINYNILKKYLLLNNVSLFL